MAEDYTVSDLERYMRQKIDSTSSYGLFEFEIQQECSEAIDSLGFHRDSGEGLLFTFATVAGGWKTDVGSKLLDDMGDALGVSDDFTAIRSADLTPVDEAGYGGHSHRHANGAHPARALRSLAEIEVAGRSVASMEDLFETLASIDPARQFDEAFQTFQSVQTFRELAAFDYLDFASRVNEQGWLVPDRLEPRYVDRNGPGKTLEKIVEGRGGDPDDLRNSAVARSVLEELQDFAETELGLSPVQSFFDVESCLCTYHGELENAGPDWRSSCT